MNSGCRATVSKAQQCTATTTTSIITTNTVTTATTNPNNNNVFFTGLIGAQGLLLVKAKRAADRDWLSGREVNSFLKRAQKTPRFKELAIERMCQVGNK